MNVSTGLTNIPEWWFQEAQCLGELRLRAGPPPLGSEDIRAAFQHLTDPGPEVSEGLDAIRPGEKVCLVVCDQTRKTGADQVLPLLLDELRRRGCREEDLLFLVATGIHRPPTPSELQQILGKSAYDVFRRKIRFHDPDDPRGLTRVGTTRRGHAVWVNAHFMAVRHRILIGTASYHYHAGFGGGRKLAVPGLAARKTIAVNHALSLDPRRRGLHPNAAPGLLDGNPVAEGMLEAARLCGPVLLLNTVLDGRGTLVGLRSGDLDRAHRAACREFERMARMEITERADIAIAFATEAPNWIQAHKALVHAERAVRPGSGWVILVAPCPEGLGDERFRRWVRHHRVADLYRRLIRAPQVYGQTALSTRVRGRRTVLVTALSERDRADLALRTTPDLETALRWTMQHVRRGRCGYRPTFYVLPEATRTVPFETPGR